jgi:hypothetical protein
MNKQETGCEFRCQSAVDRFFGAKIPLPAGSAKSYQANELNYVFAVEQALFGGRETVSPWCQGHATGSTHAPDPAAGALVIAGLCRHVVG